MPGRYGREAVDARVHEMFRDDDNEKNISYSKFVEIQKRSAKLQGGSGLKPGATMVPQVKGMSSVVDPSLAHLL